MVTEHKYSILVTPKHVIGHDPGPVPSTFITTTQSQL